MEGMNCLYVTPRSFEKYKFVVEYFKEVANKLEDQHTHSQLQSTDDISNIVTELIIAYANRQSENQPLYL